MAENQFMGPQGEVMEPQGALAQVSAPAPAPAAPAARPEPSEYEKAQAEYQRQRQSLIQQQQALIASLEARVGGPQDMMLALAAGFGKRAPTFSEGLGNAIGAFGAQQAQSRQAMSDIAKMRMELAAQQAGMAKEDIELARNRQLSNTLSSVLSGNMSPSAASAAGIPAEQASVIAQMPAEYRAMVLAQLQTGDVKGAISELNKFMLEASKKPEKVREFEYYTAQLKSPAAKSAAQQLMANNFFLGNPADRSRVIIEIRKAIYEGVMPANEGQLLIQGMNSIGGSAEAPAAAPAAPAAAPAAPSVAPAPSGAPAAAQRPPSGQVNISPRAQESVEQARREAEIKAQAAAREQAYKKLDESLRESESKASSAASTINALDRFLASSPSAAAGGLQPLLTQVKNLLSSIGISPDSLVNEQTMSAAIDQILMGKMESMGSAARALSNVDMESMRNSLPRLATDRRARDEVARIIQKSKANDIEDYRIQRINESENFPDIARVRPAPRFYLDWIKRTEDFNQLKRQYNAATTQQARDDVMQRFDSYYGIGVARQILR